MTTIKLKNGSGAPAASDLVQGEPALDLTNKRLYTENGSGTVIEVGTNPTSLTTGTFTSTGIDDNATSTAITIDADGDVGIGTTSPASVVTSSSTCLHIDGGAAQSASTLFRTANAQWEIGSWENVSANFGIFNNVAGSFALSIDTAGKVGIGTTSITNTYSSAYYTDINIDGTWGGVISFKLGGTEQGYIGQRASGNGDMAVGSSTGKNLVFQTNGNNERARIDSSGNLLVGRTNTSFGAGTNGAFTTSGGRFLNEVNGDTCLALNRTDGTGSAAVVYFYRGNFAAGQINAASGGTPAFASTSDIRLKNNVTDHESELTNVMSLRPVRWDWNNLDGVSGEGFIAQELEQTAWADLVSEGDDGYKQVSGLGAVETRLIKAMQEQQVMIEELKAEVAALKGA